jgi:hypothetical protein
MASSGSIRLAGSIQSIVEVIRKREDMLLENELSLRRFCVAFATLLRHVELVVRKR